jgi:hypothetical protein
MFVNYFDSNNGSIYLKKCKTKSHTGVSGFRKSSSFLIEDQPNYIINYKFSESTLQAKIVVNNTKYVKRKKKPPINEVTVSFLDDFKSLN